MIVFFIIFSIKLCFKIYFKICTPMAPFPRPTSTCPDCERQHFAAPRERHPGPSTATLPASVLQNLHLNSPWILPPNGLVQLHPWKRIQSRIFKRETNHLKEFKIRKKESTKTHLDVLQHGMGAAKIAHAAARCDGRLAEFTEPIPHVTTETASSQAILTHLNPFKLRCLMNSEHYCYFSYNNILWLRAARCGYLFSWLIWCWIHGLLNGHLVFCSAGLGVQLPHHRCLRFATHLLVVPQEIRNRDPYHPSCDGSTRDGLKPISPSTTLPMLKPSKPSDIALMQRISDLKECWRAQF